MRCVFRVLEVPGKLMHEGKRGGSGSPIVPPPESTPTLSVPDPNDR